jgi:hypothetical protein
MDNEAEAIAYINYFQQLVKAIRLGWPLHEERSEG